jgi:hypothetical protein
MRSGGKISARNASTSRRLGSFSAQNVADDALPCGAFLDIAGDRAGGLAFAFAQGPQFGALVELGRLDQKKAVAGRHVVQKRAKRAGHAVRRLLDAHQPPPAAQSLRGHFIHQTRGIVGDNGARQDRDAERIGEIGHGFFGEIFGAFAHQPGIGSVNQHGAHGGIGFLQKGSGLRRRQLHSIDPGAIPGSGTAGTGAGGGGLIAFPSEK